MVKDGHIHTPYCPHGTKDSLKDYVEKVIELGYKEISFTEHAPLPEGFQDPTPAKDSAMKMEDLGDYFEEISRIKFIYKEKIKINAGLEVDFIEGFERETATFLNQIGHQLDDSILSVHFLKHGSDYDCLDYSPETFNTMIQKYGSIDKVYNAYFKTLLQSIHCDLGPFKPKRIGHITLVKKFQKKYSTDRDYRPEVLEVLSAIQKKGYEIDYNGAGYSKPLCKEPYPPNWVVEEAMNRRINLVYGSDAHQVKELDQGKHIMKF